MNGVLIDAATVMGISLERLFQKAAKASGFTNYLEVGTYRYQQAHYHEESPPGYVLDFCTRYFQRDETSAPEGGQVHAAAD